MKTLFSPGDVRILVVDDEEMNRDMLSRRLERKGYLTRVAADGFEAQDLLQSERFDLVLLDIMMPRLSGLEVLHTLRKKHDAFALPVIMASAKTESDDVVSALKIGANDYITKPIDFPLALARIQAQLTVKFAMERAQASDGPYRALVEQCVDVLSIHAPDGTFRYASEGARAMLGYAPDELVDTSLLALFHPDDIGARAAQHPDRPDVHTFRVRLARKQGGFLAVEMVARTRRADDGAVSEVQVSTRDVSARG